MQIIHRLTLIMCCICLISGEPFAQKKKTNEQLLDEVKTRLLAVVEPVDGLEWPPRFAVKDRLGEGDSLNAWVAVDGGETNRKVEITKALFDKIVEGDANRLSFIVGHELAHLTLRHRPTEPLKAATPFRRLVFSREDEIAADREGLKIALKAGYSFQSIRKGIKRFTDLGYDYAPLEAGDHPAWTERLAKLDPTNADLWNAMSAFNNGRAFLQLEQYGAAERCFEATIQEFPDCYEALSNQGYAILMQYCDNLDPEDIKSFNIGHLMVGGFYLRPKSLSLKAVRGVDRELWGRAVNAFDRALALRGDLTLARANRGVCYLVAPAGPQIGQAIADLRQAAASAESDTTIDPLARMAVFVNAGVASLASGAAVECTRNLDAAQNLSSSIRSRGVSWDFVSTPITYNRALILSGSKNPEERMRAAGLFESYLRSAGRSSLWWEIAYEGYKKLCADIKKQPKTKEEILEGSIAVYRPIVGVTIMGGKEASLQEPMSDIRGKIQGLVAVPVIPGTNLVEWRDAKSGICVLGTDEVMAIRLSGTSAAEIALRLSGPGKGSVSKLQIGMSVGEIDKLLGETSYDMREFLEPDVHYRYYRHIGVGVRERKGKIVEIIVAQLPEQWQFGH